jgi:hypothetical protein
MTTDSRAEASQRPCLLGVDNCRASLRAVLHFLGQRKCGRSAEFPARHLQHRWSVFDFLGGANRNRTDDLLNAIQALSQLSYGPALGGRHIDALRPHDQAPSIRNPPQRHAWLNPEALLHPGMSDAECSATSNRAAFLHWLRAVHGIQPDRGGALRAWAEANPATASTLILQFAGPGFSSARLAAGLLLQADLRPDDRILVLGAAPVWLPEALDATQGHANTLDAATVLIADRLPDILPPSLRRLILVGGAAANVPPEITVSRPEDWTYPSESSAD